MTKKITKNTEIDKDATNPKAKKKLSTIKSNKKQKMKTEVIEISADSVLKETNLSENNGERVDVIFIDSNTVISTSEVISASNIEKNGLQTSNNKTDSKPVTSINWAVQLLIVSLFILSYILGVATATLYSF